MGRYTDRISQRLIPLPKEISCNEIKKVPVGEIKIDVIFPEDELLLSAKKKLVSYFGNSIYGTFRIRIVDPMPDTVQVLNNFMNGDQAYRIWYDGALNISGLTSKGIMNGVRTLLQATAKEDNFFNIPLLFIFDYPDMALRGQWGGDSFNDIPYTSSLKLNSLDYSGVFGVDDNNIGTASLEKPELVSVCEKEGVNLTVYIPHLEYVTGHYLDKIKDKDLIGKIKNVPTKEAAERNDYNPGLCTSSPYTEDIVFQWMCSLADIKGVKRIMVWLSETAEPCICDQCRDKEPFLLETDFLVKLFGKLKEKYPYLTCELLLTQGSFSVNEKILERVPADIPVMYYNGSKTYISDKNPMIYDGLLPFIQKGGKLGVYPQITNGWRSVFPWTAPDFIRFRCDEFVEKGLYKVVGYAVPSNIYYRFNVAAMSEWLWNSKGRNEEAFMRAYANINGIDSDGFVKWCTLNMAPAWVLADNRFVVSSMFNFRVIMKTKFNMEDFRFTDFTRTQIKDIDKYIRLADRAVKAAKAIGYEEGESESRCLSAMLRATGAYQEFFSLLHKKPRNQEEDMQLGLAYETMHSNAKSVYSNLLEWRDMIDPLMKVFQSRITDTAVFCMRISDTMKKLMDNEGIKHKEHHSITYYELGRWDESIFDDSGKAVMSYDISKIAEKDGRYHVCFDYIDCKQGTDITRIEIKEKSKTISSIIYDKGKEVIKRINMYEPWYEVMMDIEDTDKSTKRVLEVSLEGPKDKSITCRGLLGIRKV